MQQSLFALFRGADGRALARALAALLFLTSIAGQFPLGLHAAAAGEATIICTITPDAAPAVPATDDRPASCCLAICVGSLAPMVEADAAGLDFPPVRPNSFRPPAATATAVAAFALASHGPRGPPFLG